MYNSLLWVCQNHQPLIKFSGFKIINNLMRRGSFSLLHIHVKFDTPRYFMPTLMSPVDCIQLICGLFHGTVSDSDSIVLSGRLMNKQCTVKDVKCSSCRLIQGTTISQHGMTEGKPQNSQNSQFLSLHMNQECETTTFGHIVGGQYQ